MIHPVEKVTELFQSVAPDSHAIKVLALIPVISNLFLEVKKDQYLESHDPASIVKVASIIKTWIPGQLIYIAFLAKYLEKMHFNQRIITLSGLAIVAMCSDTHVNTILNQSQKNV